MRRNQFKDYEDYDHLLEVKNPDGGAALEIDVGEDDRFSLFYGGWHTHFEAYKGYYMDMLVVNDINQLTFS